MGQRADRNIINSAKRIGANGLQSNAATRFGLELAVDELNDLFGSFDTEVVEHNAVGLTIAHHLPNLIFAAHFYLYIQVQSFFSLIGFTAIERLINTSSEIYVIIF